MELKFNEKELNLPCLSVGNFNVSHPLLILNMKTNFQKLCLYRHVIVQRS